MVVVHLIDGDSIVPIGQAISIRVVERGQAKTDARFFVADSRPNARLQIKIMDEVAYNQQGKKGAEDEPGRLSVDELIPDGTSTEGFSEYTVSQLDIMLQESINREDYSKAAMIRDEISKRK